MWSNRKEIPLPKESVLIWIRKTKKDEVNIFLCRWYPYNPNDYFGTKPHEGYMGCARVIDGRYTGIGFNVWNQNNSEFIEYKLIEDERLGK